jgi:hypothetical protein
VLTFVFHVAPRSTSLFPVCFCPSTRPSTGNPSSWNSTV